MTNLEQAQKLRDTLLECTGNEIGIALIALPFEKITLLSYMITELIFEITKKEKFQHHSMYNCEQHEE